MFQTNFKIKYIFYKSKGSSKNNETDSNGQSYKYFDRKLQL